MDGNSNINPEILEECRRLAQEIGFSEEMANILIEKYQMKFRELDPYLEIIGRELSETEINEPDENEVKDYIKQLIDEHGINQKLWICKLTAEKYRLPLREAKNLFEELCGISRKEEDYFPKHLMEAHEEKESKNKEADNKIAKISLILMITGISLIFATLGITNFPKAFFFVGIGLFLAAMILMIAKGNGKKR